MFIALVLGAFKKEWKMNEKLEGERRWS